MGIEGLSLLLEAAMHSKSIQNYCGYSVGVDGMGWLHRSVYACTVESDLGEGIDAYVDFCMKYVSLLLKCNIRPVIVFDGRTLISKESINKKRQYNRESNRKKALNLCEKGDKIGAWEYFRECFEIPYKVIHAWIKVLRHHYIDYLVAPFEANAQLAFFSRTKIVDLIITDNFDLAVFGCQKIIFDLKIDGSCLVYNRSELHSSIGVNIEFDFKKFRRMCIISGCEYLESLPGIGFARAGQVVDMMTSAGVGKALKSIPKILDMDIQVSDEYIIGFHKAENTFLYQLVFNPITRKLVPLNPYVLNMDPKTMPYAGTRDIDNKTVFEMAIGNVNTKTLTPVDNFNIDEEKMYACNSKSIWSRTFVIQSKSVPIGCPKEKTGHILLKEPRKEITLKRLKYRTRPLLVCSDKADNQNHCDEESSRISTLYSEKKCENLGKVISMGAYAISDSECTSEKDHQPDTPKKENNRTPKSSTQNSPIKILTKKDNPFRKLPDTGLEANAKPRGIRILDLHKNVTKFSHYSSSTRTATIRNQMSLRDIPTKLSSSPQSTLAFIKKDIIEGSGSFKLKDNFNDDRFAKVDPIHSKYSNQQRKLQKNKTELQLQGKTLLGCPTSEHNSGNPVPSTSANSTNSMEKINKVAAESRGSVKYENQAMLTTCQNGLRKHIPGSGQRSIKEMFSRHVNYDLLITE